MSDRWSWVSDNLRGLPPEPLAPNKTRAVLAEVREERGRQDGRWGEQSHPDNSPSATSDVHEQYRRIADNWKLANDLRVSRGKVAWDGILLEEVYEALSESDPARLREELIQSAAVCLAWVECIDRRNGGDR